MQFLSLKCVASSFDKGKFFVHSEWCSTFSKQRDQTMHQAVTFKRLKNNGKLSAKMLTRDEREMKDSVKYSHGFIYSTNQG